METMFFVTDVFIMSKRVSYFFVQCAFDFLHNIGFNKLMSKHIT